jgi:2-polyprenyl-6-methoxyphenol hydroxylase-like FAD-dependent oxidoreductase
MRVFEHLGIFETYASAAEMYEEGSTWVQYFLWKDSSEIADVKTRGPHSHIHRKRVLETLVSLLPPNVQTHFSSRIVSVSSVAASPVVEEYVRLEILTAKSTQDRPAQAQEQVWTFEADAVIGADGIKSVVRELIDVDARLRWTGLSIYRDLVPMKHVKEMVGDFPNARNWIGPGKVWLYLIACANYL